MVSILIGLFMRQQVVIVAVAFLYISRMQNQSGSYHLRNTSTCVSLRPLQSENTALEELF